MTALRFVLMVDGERRLQLPEGVPFQAGEAVHVLWDGNVLQVSRTKPKRLDDAFSRVQKDAGRVLETDELGRRLADDEARKRKKFDDALRQFFKDEPGGQ